MREKGSDNFNELVKESTCPVEQLTKERICKFTARTRASICTYFCLAKKSNEAAAVEAVGSSDDGSKSDIIAKKQQLLFSEIE